MNFWCITLILGALSGYLDGAVMRLPAQHPYSANFSSTTKPKSVGLNAVQLGLYNDNEHVLLLNKGNFESLVLKQNHSILVEFYNSYCGHCKRFAPHYKELAEKLYSWREILPIGAIDCAADENNGICREYEVMAYPTLRYFKPNYSPQDYPKQENNLEAELPGVNEATGFDGGKYGLNLNVRDYWKYHSILAQLLMKENRTVNMINWPNLQPTTLSRKREDVETVETKYTIMVYIPMAMNNTNSSTLGPELILHFTRWPDLRIVYTMDLKVAQSYSSLIEEKESQIQMVAIEEANQHSELIPVHQQSMAAPTDSLSSPTPLNEMNQEMDALVVENSVKAIKEYFETNNRTKDTITERPVIKENLLILDMNESSIEQEGYNVREIVEEVKRNKHFIYRADIEMAIRYILLNEVPKVSKIYGDKLRALHHFLGLLNRYKPLQWSAEGQSLLEEMHSFSTADSLEDGDNVLSGSDFERKAQDLLLHEYTNAFQAKHYVGCSTMQKNGLRGFTCSLWQLFHYLTVLATEDPVPDDPLYVLNGIHGYVKHFFGCTECSQHFQVKAGLSPK